VAVVGAAVGAERWQALLVGVASSAQGEDRSFAQSLDSQAEFARAIERNMPGLAEDDLTVLPEPWYAREVTDRIAELNEAHDEDARAGRPRPGLLLYYCGHGMAHEDGRLYLKYRRVDRRRPAPQPHRPRVGRGAACGERHGLAPPAPRVHPRLLLRRPGRRGTGGGARTSADGRRA
jgi:hypothetical protein